MSVEMMGGAKPILAKGRALYDEGKYRHAREILNKLLYAEPQNQEAKDLLAEVFEQLKTLLVLCDPGFDIIAGTGGADLVPEEKPFQAEDPASSAGG